MGWSFRARFGDGETEPIGDRVRMGWTRGALVLAGFAACRPAAPMQQPRPSEPVSKAEVPSATSSDGGETDAGALVEASVDAGSLTAGDASPASDAGSSKASPYYPVAIDLVAATAAASASNRFGFDLFDHVRRPDENSSFSPASVAISLAMASEGARGATRAEMAHALRIDSTIKSSRAFGSLLTLANDFNGRDGLVLHVADQLWGQRGIAFEQASPRTRRAVRTRPSRRP